MNEQNIAVVGLGYVGLPVAVAFAEKYNVIGFDINDNRIEELNKGVDRTEEVSSEKLRNSTITFTSNPKKLRKATFIIVAVPTPITENKQPDLTPLKKAALTIGENLSPETIIVYESTVFPGATEEICVPLLEKASGMKCGKGFFVGYSPERINPGDKKHTFKNITKVVSGQNEQILNIIANIYGSVINADIYKASSIKVAEAAKVIENTQRDLNIALMNELAIIFEKLDIDTHDVLEAANTKWNFLKFTPGLVGGHCIGVDPYYLTHKAQQVGYHPEIILSGRKINDNMGQFIATKLIKEMIKEDILIQNSTVTILGITFKENVPDIRNTKVVELVKELQDYNINVQVTDPYACPNEVMDVYRIKLIPEEELRLSDAVILAVPHDKYLENDWEYFTQYLKGYKGLVFDIKSKLDQSLVPNHIYLKRL